MDTGLSRSEMAHQGVMGFSLLFLVIVSVKFPEQRLTEPDSSHDHLLKFKPSPFWGPSSCHFPKASTYLNPVHRTVCSCYEVLILLFQLDKV